VCRTPDHQEVDVVGELTWSIGDLDESKEAPTETFRDSAGHRLGVPPHRLVDDDRGHHSHLRQEERCGRVARRELLSSPR
jgi:hypothetical protein